ncbi:MAG TPA: hypothetical protein VGR22_07870, partial [Thermomicrobiales bacterium]|nr:hypothetical protein [Thermomicrobiales bacterium]
SHAMQPDQSTVRVSLADWLGAHSTVITRSVTAAIVLGVLVRLVAALTLSPHVDEPASVLAAHVVAERGLPLLPSGTPYFQGLTLSYLLQPFVWLGIGGIEHLHLMRLVLVLAGAVTLYLCYRLALVVTGDPRVGVVMATLVALDPVSVQWSAHVRMYGLLQPLTLALAWAWIVFLRGNTGWRQVALVAGIYWAAVFTHVGASLLAPAMAVAAFVLWRWQVFRRWRLMVTLTIAALGPMLLLALNELFGTANEPVRESSSLPFFVGANLLAPLTEITHPVEEWTARLTAGITLYWMMPVIIVGVSTLIGARYLLRRGTGDDTRAAVAALLALYWLPLLAVVLLTASRKVRYIVHLHVLGYLFLAVLLVALLHQTVTLRGDSRLRLLARHAAIIGIVTAVVAGLGWRLENRVVQPDYNQAMAYVADRHQPGEPVIVTLPPVGYLTMDESNRDDLYFLAGSAGWTRADRYTRWDEDGRLIDYWIGADSIVSTRMLDEMLATHDNAWVIADRDRLEDDWTSTTAIERVIRESMFPVYASDGGAVVYRTLPEQFRHDADILTNDPAASGVGVDDACLLQMDCPPLPATPVASPAARGPSVTIW